MTNDVLDKVLALSLKDMDGSLLTHALLKSSSTLGMDTEVVAKSLATASYYHRKATRSNRANLPRTHYVEHPLRNALRLIRYGVTDQNIIVATILHDVVEDCAAEITNDLLGPEAIKGDRSETFLRDKALQYIADEFNEEVSLMVELVSNPFTQRGLSKEAKRELYIDHVQRVIRYRSVFLIKFSDWADNAVGLHHNNAPGNEGMVKHLAAKYLPLADIFESQLEKLDLSSSVSDDGLHKIKAQISSGRESLSSLLTQKA